MSEKFLIFKVLSDKGHEEVAVNAGLIRVIKHHLGENDGDPSMLYVYFIDEPEPHQFKVEEKVADMVLLRLREMRP